MTLAGALEHGDRRTHAGQTLNLAEQRFAEASRTARLELVGGLADHPIGELGDRSIKARARDLRREQQRHPDGDPEHREQLLDEHDPRFQPHHIQVGDVRQPHR